jgi:hypothetical protein
LARFLHVDALQECPDDLKADVGVLASARGDADAAVCAHRVHQANPRRQGPSLQRPRLRCRVLDRKGALGHLPWQFACDRLVLAQIGPVGEHRDPPLKGVRVLWNR